MCNIYLKKKFKLSFADILSTCQLHISLTRTAQIYLELHFCVQLHAKKAMQQSKIAYNTKLNISVRALCCCTVCQEAQLLQTDCATRYVS